MLTVPNFKRNGNASGTNCSVRNFAVPVSKGSLIRNVYTLLELGTAIAFLFLVPN